MLHSYYAYILQQDLIAALLLNQSFLEAVGGTFLVTIPKHSQVFLFGDEAKSLAPMVQNSSHSSQLQFDAGKVV